MFLPALECARLTMHKSPFRFLVALGLTGLRPALPLWISLTPFHMPLPQCNACSTSSDFCWNQAFFDLFTSLTTSLLAVT